MPLLSHLECPALNAARRGLRTIVAEPAGAARLPEIFRVPGQGYTPTRLAEGLYSISITPEEAMEERFGTDEGRREMCWSTASRGHLLVSGTHVLAWISISK